MDLTYVLAYIMFGVLWSILKYWLHLLNFKDKYDDMKIRYFDDYPKNTIEAWDKYISNEKKYYKPNKDKIMNWMIWWIPSITWTIINDPIRKAFRWSYKRIVGVYDGIYEKVLGDL